ncbi:pyruvate synthase [Solemya velum gill symbiont]|uniref:Pyruvate ferredoxin oxidoreductase, alpha subunit n=2 Tax=Solemya velum gill symbiont TaxID=2340 RepID=A0A0B0H6G3_SOVGS|nr:pyruvate synthase [Solemya velum gill symbiont]KHF25783.1 pyruvate ferredoxin oxidoreductase, alpha subunit [Solemya velum gill symbiont]OOY35630.1 pyruvate synthase [Solemya velum gill symbiont]OOY38258.1 pyruvate synthase [Solemya velum gill symbiont]OOY41968.1 pyruvate synthase [Solemya velum gill symbiont]OOY46983.1 pyruvate synthase [Solemya velum gill symbiont]
MKRTLLTGNAAAAWGARLANVDYIPSFPITPQTEIIESLSEWIDNGEMPGRLVTLESEHSMITAAGSAAATGIRTFSATSSQGLLYGMEMLYTVSGWRAPFVLVNVSRGLSSPITLEPDHNDIFAARDCGFLQIHCASCQEILDSILIAYRLGEDARVRLPVIVNMDGFYLSFTREPVVIPDEESAREFVGNFDPENIHFSASAPESQAVAVLGGGPYSYFRYETHLAAMNGLAAYEEIAEEFGQRFGRSHSAVESYCADDADYLFVMLGSFATKAKEAVDRLRVCGWSIGLVRPRLVRPFPASQLQHLLADRKGIAVIDQNISMGMGGVLHSELATALYGQSGKQPILASFIGALGGRDIAIEEFFEIAEVIKQAASSGVTPPPRLLYTREELREIRKLQAVARAERDELNNNSGHKKGEAQ